MKGEKQSRVENLEKRVAAMTNVIQHLINEAQMLKDLSVGTLEVVKLIPGYDDALEQIKAKAAESSEKKEVKLEIPDDE